MLLVPQALLLLESNGSARWLAWSAEFDEAWRPALEDLVRAFGERPAGVTCPEAIFAQPFGDDRVIVCRVCDQANGLGFHTLALTTADYAAAGAHPFAIAAAVPALWEARGSSLPAASLPPLERLPTTSEIGDILRRPESPLLLGTVQALVDGNRGAWVRPEPAGELLAGLWHLLPLRCRQELWPASFAFSNKLQFHAVVVPQVRAEEFDFRYLSEAQLENYPEGAYEARLQSAAEHGDEGLLAKLLLRRSHSDTLRLGFWLLAGMLALSILAGAIKVLQNLQR
ncbi:MAG TPA: hypothetical protein PKD86_05665 [Gemmatales bacterium]|nr:hypothetical protein [Gemmatales bacterium]